jgi:Kef-type K+ transport system membrane component KefB
VIGYFLLVASLYAWGAMHFGSFAAVPAAFFGGYLLIFSHPEWKDRVDVGLRSFLGSLPIGIFFIVLGMQVDFRGAEKWAVPLALATAMVVGAKIISARIALNSFLQSSRERLQVISGTLQPGEIGILIAVYLFSRGLVDPFMFRGAVTVLMALTLLSSIMMRMAGKESMNPKVKLSALKGGACGAHAGHCEERRDEGVSKK